MSFPAPTKRLVERNPERLRLVELRTGLGTSDHIICFLTDRSHYFPAGILGLGIAANVIVFGVVQALILQPLDAPRADRVVTFATSEQGYPAYSYPEVRDVRDENTVFSAVAAYMFDMFGLEVNGRRGEMVQGHTTLQLQFSK